MLVFLLTFFFRPYLFFTETPIKLYTKSYEYFKANKTGRMSLFIASKIALTHFESGKHDLALKFVPFLPPSFDMI